MTQRTMGLVTACILCAATLVATGCGDERVRSLKPQETGNEGGSEPEVPDAGPGYGSAYNLIVDEFHTFFVGDARILAHDNTFFGMPLGLVPGLPAY